MNIRRYYSPIMVILIAATPFTVSADENSNVSPRIVKAIDDFKRENPRTNLIQSEGIVHSVSGKAFSTGLTPAASVDAFMAKHGVMMGVSGNNLRVKDVQPIMNGKFSLHRFEQVHNGVPVHKSQASMLVRLEPNHPLVFMNATTRPLPDKIPVHTLTMAQAQAIAQADTPAITTFEPAELVIFAENGVFAPAWRFWAEDPDPANHVRWGYVIDATNGTILEKRNGIVHADITGTVEGFGSPGVDPDQPGNPPVALPLHGARVFRNNADFTFVEPDGSFVLPYLSDEPTVVSVNLDGQWCSVENTSPDAVNLAAQEGVFPPEFEANFLLNELGAPLLNAQVNAMIHTTRFHDHVTGIIPSLTALNISIPAFVNIADTCNASYSLGSPRINFFAAEPGPQPACPNTSYSTVIYHEYGHFVVDSAQGFNAAGDYHEGMADTVSSLFVNDPCVGADFRGVDTGCLRNVDEPDFVFPVGSGSVHIDGLAIAGSFWDLRTELINSLGEDEGLQLVRELMFNQILIGPPLLGPGIANAVLTLDDDDDDIFNGTPHYVQIQSAFERHGMPGPVLALLEFDFPQGLPDTASPLAGASVMLDITDGPAGTQLAPDTVVAHFLAADGTPISDQPLSEVEQIENGARFEVDLPEAECYEIYRWFVTADTDSGETLSFPANAPTELFRSAVATNSTVRLRDGFDEDNGWTVETIPAEDPFKNGVNLSEGGWERMDPAPVFNPSDNNAMTQPGNDFGGFSVLAYVTSGAAGDLIDPGAFDVDWGPTMLTSPPLTFDGGDATISYARWFYNDDGDDALKVEISGDDGITWQTIESVTGSTGWVQTQHLISDFAIGSNEVRVRFRTEDTPNNSITEACIDEFELIDLVCAPADVDNDQDVDLLDFAGFQRCFGPDDSIAPGCDIFDFDNNDVLTLRDFAELQHVIESTP